VQAYAIPATEPFATLSDVSEMHPYTVRESPRATRVRLRMSHSGDLEVVVPRGFDTRQVPGLVESQRDWIGRAARRIGRQRATLPPGHTAQLPDVVDLAALAESRSVEYRQNTAGRASVREQADGGLVVRGDTSDIELCRAALRRWLRRTATARLVPWLGSLAEEGGFTYQRTCVRMQRARWGSASTRGTISLNAKMLFFPPRLVEHVLLHELCHTVHPNHSKAFHELLRACDPDACRHARDLRTAWRFVPDWAEE